MAAMAQVLSLGIERFTTHKPTLGTPESKRAVYKLDDSLVSESLCQMCDVPNSSVNHIGTATKTLDQSLVGTIVPREYIGPISEGSLVSRTLAGLPGFNSGGVTHDISVGFVERTLGVTQLSGWSRSIASTFTNQMTIAPVIGLKYYAAGVGNYKYYWENLEE